MTQVIETVERIVRFVTIVAIVPLSENVGCVQARRGPERPLCSRESVLSRLGKAIEKDDLSSIWNDLLSASDLIALRAPGKVASTDEASRTFDSESFKDATLMISAIRHRMHHPRFKRAEVAKLRRWSVQGTNVQLDADEQSYLIFEDDGHVTKMSVERIVRLGNCWKIETVGYGISVSSKSGRTSVAATRGFKRITSAELCTGLLVYATPEKSEALGEVVEQYERYRDNRTGQVFPAVLLKTHINGQIKGKWEKLGKVFSSYCRTDDPALTSCRWSVRKEEVTADPSDEIPPE